MPYDINAALERLEKNLLEVETAKSQVESTVAASRELQQVVGRYTGSLAALSKEVSAFVGEVRDFEQMGMDGLGEAVDRFAQAYEAVVKKFDAEADKTIKALQAGCDASVARLGAENGRLAEQVGSILAIGETLAAATRKMGDVKNAVDAVSASLKKVREEQGKVLAEQDNALAGIKSAVDRISPTVATHVDSASEKLVGRVVPAIKQPLSEVSSQVGGANQKIDRLKNSLAEVRSDCGDMKESIAGLRSSVEDGFKSVNAHLEAVQKSAILNRWILVAGILLLAALHFVVGR